MSDHLLHEHQVLKELASTLSSASLHDANVDGRMQEVGVFVVCLSVCFAVLLCVM